MSHVPVVKAAAWASTRAPDSGCRRVCVCPIASGYGLPRDKLFQLCLAGQHKSRVRRCSFCTARQCIAGAANTYTVWLGDDLLDHDRLQIPHNYVSLQDQLRLEMAAGRTFVHLQEAPITFRPTYKFDKHSMEPLDYDSSEKRRCLSLPPPFKVQCVAK